MPDDTSNIDEIERMFDSFDQSIDFTRPGREGSLGEDLLDDQALRISDRARQEEGPGGPWDANQGEYGERKRKRGLPVGRGMKTADGSPDVMLSLVNLKGERSITPSEATMTFGVSQAAKDKGNYFTHGSEGPDGLRSGAVGQPAREFFVLTPEDESEILDRAGDAVGEWLKSL